MNQAEFDFEKKREAASAEVIERIKKLLRLGASKANRHEAELALQRAFEIARKYDVDVESLDLDERTARITHEWFAFVKHATFLQVRELGVTGHFFRVKVVTHYASKMMFVGLPTDITIAHYVYEFIVRCGNSELKAFGIAERKARRKMSTSKRKSFIMGFIYGIITQLNKSEHEQVIEDAKKALVIAEKQAREKYASDEVPDTKPLLRDDAKRRNKTALDQGWDAGIKSTIHTPLTGGVAATLALENV